MRRFAPLLCAAVFVCSPAVFAQDAPVAPEAIAADPPAHVSYVEGTAVLERDGEPDASPTNMPLLAGDRIRTARGRVEVLFADGSLLHIDNDTTVDFQSDELVRLLTGRVRLTIPGPNREVAYRIDAPLAWAQINQPGEYRVAIDREEVELAVLRGAADLMNNSGRTALRAGERAFSRADVAPSTAYVFNSASWDAFDRWAETRRDQRLGVSTQYLPDEVRPYAASFDQYGSWQYDSSNGYVWYPTVSTGWRPYYNGRWASLRPFGWTWIGADPWAWPTHHYGRWGFSAGAWFWIPGRSWAPAWVSWAYAPGFVSWCPLGFNNRPVFQIVNVNFRNRGFDPFRAWTVVPQRRFGVGRVNTGVIAAGAIDARTRGSFVGRDTAPGLRGHAVPRAGTAIRVAGTAVPRGGSSPVYTNLAPGASRVGSSGSRTMVGSPRTSVAGDSPNAARPEARSRAVPRGTPSAPDRPGAAAAASPGRDDRTEPRGAAGAVNAPRSASPDTSPRPNDRALPRGAATERATPGASAPYANTDRPYGSIERVPARRAPSGVPSREPDGAVDRGSYRAVPRTDTPRTESPRTDSPRTESPRTESPRTDPPSYRGAPYRAPGGVVDRGPSGPPRAVPRGDQPRGEAPRGEAPRAGAPSRSNPGNRAPAPAGSAPAGSRPRGGRGGR